MAGGKWGYIDRTGRFAIQPQFDFAKPFREGLAAVEIADKYGYIDKAGKIVVKPRFHFASEFDEGLARIAVENKEGGWKYGYINKGGRLVISPEYDGADTIWRAGLAGVRFGKRSACIDRTGKVVFWMP